jgi:hypothetical protein
VGLAQLLLSELGARTKILQDLLDVNGVLQSLELLLVGWLLRTSLRDFQRRELRLEGTMVAEPKQVHEDGRELERHELGGLERMDVGLSLLGAKRGILK